MDSKYSIGKMDEMWGSSEKGSLPQTITFVVTEDCNLRCKYCYITHKSSKKRMSFQVAKDFIDYLLSDRIQRPESVIIEFIGGEPLMEIELIDRITDYFKAETYKRNVSWYWNYRINICSNGVNYSDSEVQKYLLKNQNKMSMSITIDGTKDKHDLQRVFADGSGSYDIVSGNVDLWMKQFKPHTKVTFSSADLVFLKDSIIELWNRGIKMIGANVVFENVWKDGDEIVFEEQLKKLADYIIDHDIYNKGFYCTLFSDSIGEPYTDEDLKMTSCGAGYMLALDPDGKIYPCIRYKDYSLNNREEWTIGTVKCGIDAEKVRAFDALMYSVQSDDECLSCPVAKGCAFCQGFNYDEAETATNFQRAKYICKMHKARVRANNYYWSKLYNLKGVERETYRNESRKMYFLLTDDFVSFCCVNNKKTISCADRKMESEVLLRGLRYAHENFYKPIFVHGDISNEEGFPCTLDEYRILHICKATDIEAAKKYKDHILVFDEVTFDMDFEDEPSVILNIDASGIIRLSDITKELFRKTERINLNIQGIDHGFDFAIYENQLMEILDQIRSYGKKQFKEINVITDLSFIKTHEGCFGGDSAIVYAPDGGFYTCPYEYKDSESKCGDPDIGIDIKNQRLLTLKYQPLCVECANYQCDRCHYENRYYTKEVNIPASFRCKKSMIERKASRLYYESIGKEYKSIDKWRAFNCNDPMDKIKAGISINSRYKVLC